MQTIINQKASTIRPFPKLMISTSGSGNVFAMESETFGVCIAQGKHEGYIPGVGNVKQLGDVTTNTEYLVDFVGSITLMNQATEAMDDDARPAITRSENLGMIYFNYEGAMNVILKQGHTGGCVCNTPLMTVRDDRTCTSPYNQPVTITQY